MIVARHKSTDLIYEYELFKDGNSLGLFKIFLTKKNLNYSFLVTSDSQYRMSGLMSENHRVRALQTARQELLKWANREFAFKKSQVGDIIPLKEIKL